MLLTWGAVWMATTMWTPSTFPILDATSRDPRLNPLLRRPKPTVVNTQRLVEPRHTDVRRLPTNTVPRCAVEGDCVEAGTTCLEGTCRQTHGQDRTTSCLTSCEADVLLDEQFYYNGEPSIVQRMSNTRGCVVVFRRNRGLGKTVTVERWQKERRGVVVRTDRSGSLWTAWCPWSAKVRCGVDAECDGPSLCLNQTCVSYMTETNDGAGCVEPCLEEVALYESHYYNRKVEPVEAFGSVKGGCTVEYDVVGETAGVSKEDYEKQSRGNMKRTGLVGGVGRWVAWCAAYTPTLTPHTTAIPKASEPIQNPQIPRKERSLVQAIPSYGVHQDSTEDV